MAEWLVDDLDIMEGVKCNKLKLLIKGLTGMENTAVAFSQSGQDDANMSMMKIQWTLDNAVQQAFKVLKSKLGTNIKALSDVVEFKEKNPELTPPPPGVDEPDLVHDSDYYSDDESDYSL